MRKTVTTYACDGCGKKTKNGRELRRFSLLHKVHGSWDSSNALDLCDSCEARLIEATEPILGPSVIDLRREPEVPKSKPRRRAAKPREERSA